MLVLSRKADEAIEIFVPGQKPITLTVIEIRSDKVRIGCAADRSITIHRAEVARAIERSGEKIGGEQ